MSRAQDATRQERLIVALDEVVGDALVRNGVAALPGPERATLHNALRAALVDGLGALARELGLPTADDGQTPPPVPLPTAPGAVVLATEVRGEVFDPPLLAVRASIGCGLDARCTPEAGWARPDRDIGSPYLSLWPGDATITRWLPARVVRDDVEDPDFTDALAALREVVTLLDGPQSEAAQAAQDVAKAALRRLDGAS